MLIWYFIGIPIYTAAAYGVLRALFPPKSDADQAWDDDAQMAFLKDHLAKQNVRFRKDARALQAAKVALTQAVR